MEIRTSTVDQGSRFALLPFAISSSGLAGLLDPRRGGCGSSFRTGFGGRFGGRIGIVFGFGDLAELLQVLLDGAGSASDGVGSQLEDVNDAILMMLELEWGTCLLGDGFKVEFHVRDLEDG